PRRSRLRPPPNPSRPSTPRCVPRRRPGPTPIPVRGETPPLPRTGWAPPTTGGVSLGTSRPNLGLPSHLAFQRFQRLAGRYRGPRPVELVPIADRVAPIQIGEVVAGQDLIQMGIDRHHGHFFVLVDGAGGE